MTALDPYLCPKCHIRGRVIDSRQRNGYRYRAHACGVCGLHWPSYHSRLNVRRAILKILATQSQRNVSKSTS